MTDERFPLHLSVVDIGSNTIKTTHARADQQGAITQLAEAAETIRLGAGVEESGRIAPDRLDACIAELRRQEAIGVALGSTVFAGVATETLRIAANGADLLDRIQHETAWDVRVITGDDEAHLTWLGLRDQIPVEGNVLIVDIGGGSTEIISVEQEKVAFSTSIPLGSGRLADRLFTSDPPRQAALDAATDHATHLIREVEHLPAHANSVVFSGGNGVFLAQLASQLFPGRRLSPEVIAALLAHLASTPASDTAGRLGIAHERAKVLPAGAAIALAMLGRITASSVSAAPSGIRTGLIREIASRQFP